VGIKRDGLDEISSGGRRPNSCEVNGEENPRIFIKHARSVGVRGGAQESEAEGAGGTPLENAETDAAANPRRRSRSVGGMRR